ncbi:MGH1-like glycoside hydrolase domain-containing protein [Cypionkella sp. TWP1-2-1b2]|uniref:MGH1-like glycoside hydrolase domain-containing protein n=1 Tax=Cypionkella sp. TWP1-2-1b2 TaxID=2804675 RepID=UPI003CF9C66C
MLKHPNVSTARAWNSWSDRPGEMVFLPLGIRVTPLLYSSRLRQCIKLEPRTDTLRLGRHNIEGSLIEFEADLAGTTLAFATTKPQPFAFRTTWTAQKTAEWGLRFWVNIAISAEDGTEARFDPTQNITLLQSGDRFTAIATQHPPVQVTGHATLDALCDDYTENGYFTRDSRATSAPVLALRFNLEMMRSGTYAAAVADSAALAIAAAKAALFAQQPAADPTTPHAESLSAIHDIVGWNTIWDVPNNRPYTAVTRIWNLGTYAVWHNDQTYAALLAGIFDTELARENLATALSAATPQGNFACIATSRDTWVDRSQPPLGSLIAWQLYQRSGERSILEQCYPAMARNQRWWREMRDPEGTGLISCGSSDVGEALYKGTAFGARNETGMDNSATHDEAIYQPETRSLSTWDLGLNCVVALDAEMLALIATTLGHNDDAAEFDTLAKNHRGLIQTHLWDETRQIFANRQRHGAFVKSLSPTSFYPLLCNAATQEQATHLLRHLANPATFAGKYPLPNATRDDPAFADNVYWRGRIWPNINYLVWLGLRRSGHYAEASLLAEQSLNLFLQNWRTNRIAAENYNATTGEAMDQGDTDPFYIWAGLLPLMAVSALVDIDPWHGLTLTNNAQPTHCGPMVSPFGPLSVTVKNATLTATINTQPALSFTFLGTLTQLHLHPSRTTATLHRVTSAGQIILHRTTAEAPLIAHLNGKVIRAIPIASGFAFDITSADQAAKLDVIFPN